MSGIQKRNNPIRQNARRQCGVRSISDHILLPFFYFLRSEIYAAVTMQTAYLKANYRYEYAAGLLTSVMDNSDKLMKYVGEYRLSGIKVLPPDVTKSEYGFTIEGDAIRFGLFAVKGVGKDVAEGIPAKRREKPYAGIEDFVTRNPEIDKGALASLTASGALDAFGHTRHTLNENVDALIKARKQDKDADTGQLSLFDFGIDIKPDPVIIKEFPEYSFLELCRMEKETTGMYISGHPAASIGKLALENGAVNIGDLLDENSTVRENDAVPVYGVVTEVTRKTTKNGKPMMILKLDDWTGEITVFAFDRAIQMYSGELQEDKLLLLRGKFRGDAEDGMVILDQLCEIKETPSILWFLTDDSELTHIRKRASAFMEKYSGVSDFVYIASRTSRKQERLGRISLSGDVLERTLDLTM